MQWKEDGEKEKKKKKVQGLNPVCYLSQHGSHTYIEAYLFSMITIAYLCIKTVYFNLYWMVYVLLGLLRCYFLLCLLQTEDNGLSLLSQNMVWIRHISVSLRFKKGIKNFYKYVCVSSGYLFIHLFSVFAHWTENVIFFPLELETLRMITGLFIKEMNKKLLSTVTGVVTKRKVQDISLKPWKEGKVPLWTWWRGETWE